MEKINKQQQNSTTFGDIYSFVSPGPNQ